jgi:hypothetical protein
MTRHVARAGIETPAAQVSGLPSLTALTWWTDVNSRGRLSIDPKKSS